LEFIKTPIMHLIEILTLMQAGHGLYQTAAGWIINGQTVDMGRCEWLLENGFIQHSAPDDYEKYVLTDKGKNTPPDQVMLA
jgi:hypothetical protein